MGMKEERRWNLQRKGRLIDRELENDAKLSLNLSGMRRVLGGIDVIEIKHL